jgi:hypothetical protein
VISGVPTPDVITNPATHAPYAGNVINTDPINPVDLQKLLNILYPKPTQAGCGTNTFEAGARS